MSHGFALEEAVEKKERIPKSGPVRWLHNLVHGLNSICLNLSMVAVVLAALVLTSSVALRYWLKIPTDWQDEMSVFLLVGAIFSCGSYVQSQRGNIGIEAISSLLSPKVNQARQFICDFLSLAFCTFFSWKSWALLHEAWVDGMTTSSTWAPPLWIPYGLMAFGMTLMTLQLLLQVVEYFCKTTEEA
ncbi:MAG: TRAP transporter small permease [Fluviibacter sp.]